MFNQSSLRKAALASMTVAFSVACNPSLGKEPHPEIKYETPMTRAAFESELGHKAEAEGNELQHMLMDPDTMFDPQKRHTLLTTAKPLLLQYRADFKELGEKFPGMEKNAVAVDEQTTQRLALLGDEETLNQLQADVAGTDVPKALTAQCILLDNEWTLADGNIQKQTAIVDKLEKLDQAHPDSDALTNLTFKFSGHGVAPTLHDRLLDLAIAMNNPTAAKLVKSKQIRDASKETAGLEGKPFVLTGKTSDGKDFSTADWKGKVIMVDFWATWCGPCKEQLPTIEKLYADNHDKGFEMVSVSNDFDMKALQNYTAANNMPWPELVNTDAMQKHDWNPMTLAYGIDGIPHSFVIDKKGNLITANAGPGFKAIVEKALAAE